jgi:RloB-like protein
MRKKDRRHPPSLGRRSATRDPKSRAVIVCEGLVTEPDYLSSFARECNALVSIKLVKGAGVPMSVVQHAMVERRTILKNSDGFAKNDQVWAVFDRDEHPNFTQAINQAESAGVAVACSNPCFELWVVLHYQDHDAPIGRSEIQKKLRVLMAAYDDKGSKRIDFGQVRELVEIAEKRASVLEKNRRNEGAPGGNPSTTVFKLTQAIRKLGSG